MGTTKGMLITPLLIIMHTATKFILLTLGGQNQQLGFELFLSHNALKQKYISYYPRTTVVNKAHSYLIYILVFHITGYLIVLMLDHQASLHGVHPARTQHASGDGPGQPTTLTTHTFILTVQYISYCSKTRYIFDIYLFYIDDTVGYLILKQARSHRIHVY